MHGVQFSWPAEVASQVKILRHDQHAQLWSAWHASCQWRSLRYGSDAQRCQALEQPPAHTTLYAQLLLLLLISAGFELTAATWGM